MTPNDDCISKPALNVFEEKTWGAYSQAESVEDLRQVRIIKRSSHIF